MPCAMWKPSLSNCRAYFVPLTVTPRIRFRYSSSRNAAARSSVGFFWKNAIIRSMLCGSPLPPLNARAIMSSAIRSGGTSRLVCSIRRSSAFAAAIVSICSSTEGNSVKCGICGAAWVSSVSGKTEAADCPSAACSIAGFSACSDVGALSASLSAVWMDCGISADSDGFTDTRSPSVRFPPPAG